MNKSNIKYLLGIALTTYLSTSNAMVVGIAETGDGNCAPFGCTSSGDPMYQQVYGSSIFNGQLLINSLSFYHTAYEGQSDFTAAGTYTISLSTTQSTVDGLSSSPLSNLGVDVTEVFSGRIDRTVSFGGQMDIILSTPFYYDPDMGNLIMQVISTNKYMVVPDRLYFDFSRDTSDQMSRLTGNIGNQDSFGLITGFNEAGVSVVPIPAAIWLFGAGLISLIGCAKRRNGRAV